MDVSKGKPYRAHLVREICKSPLKNIKKNRMRLINLAFMTETNKFPMKSGKLIKIAISGILSGM